MAVPKVQWEECKLIEQVDVLAERGEAELLSVQIVASASVYVVLIRRA